MERKKAISFRKYKDKNNTIGHVTRLRILKLFYDICIKLCVCIMYGKEYMSNVSFCN